MTKQKDQRSLRKKIGKGILNLFSEILESSRIKVSNRYNAKYNVEHLAANLALMAKSSYTAEHAANELQEIEGMPSGKWVRDRINSLGPKGVENLCRDLMERSVKFAKSKYRYRRVMVAMDKHLIPRHDKNNMKYLIRSKSKGGTRTFEGYGTMQVVAESVPAILDCMQITKKVRDADIVTNFIDKLDRYRIRPSKLLVDREFYSVEIINLISDRNLKFIMPVIKHAGAKKAILEHDRGERNAVSRYTITNAKKETATFTMVIVPSKKKGVKKSNIVEKYYAYATNLSVQYSSKNTKEIQESYKRRWGIETGYRQIEDIRPRTTSRNHFFRSILFFISLFIYNMWKVMKNQADMSKMLTLRITASAIVRVASSPFELVGQPFDPGTSD